MATTVQHLRDLRQYITDLNATPRLSREEVRQLTSAIAAARQESPSSDLAAQAKQRLIEGHLWLAVALVKRSGARLCTLSPLDLVQEGNLGLLRAFDRFDFASGGNFTAYALTTIHYAILDALPMEDTIRLSHDLSWRNRTDERVEALRALQPLSLDAAHGDEDCAFVDLLAAPSLVLPDPAAEGEEEQRQQAKRAQVEALLAWLTPREQAVIRLRYGLDEADGRVRTPTAIARKLGIECSTVCNLERHALQKLRAPQDMEVEGERHPGAPRQPRPPRLPQEQLRRRQEQFQRLEAAWSALEAQGVPISVRSLARLTHVDKQVIEPFLRLYWERQGSEQERVARACSELEAEDVPITLAGLCRRAHVGGMVAAAFLKHYQPRPKPPHPAAIKQVTSKEAPQERLQQAYAWLLAQGEPISRKRLRQEAGVSTDAARLFLRQQRTSTGNTPVEFEDE